MDDFEQKILADDPYEATQLRMDKLNFPKESFDNVSTKTLVDMVMAYPFTGNVMAYDDLKKGFDVLRKHFNAMDALLERPDAENAIRAYMDSFDTKIPVYDRVFWTCLLSEAIGEDYGDLERAITAYYVYTPAGTAVSVLKRGELLRDDDKAAMQAYMLAQYPSATMLSPATTHYNCHSYAWYSQNVTTNKYWVNNPSSYMSDTSYILATSSTTGLLRVYYGSDDHSGLRLAGYTTIRSK